MNAAEMYNYFETYIAAGNTGGGAAWAPFAAQIISLVPAERPGRVVGVQLRRIPGRIIVRR